MRKYLIFLLLTLSHCQGKENPSDKNNKITVQKDHHKKEVAIFVYHRFGNSKYPSTNISLENFEKHLSYLKSNNFKILTFSESVDYINNTQIEYYDKVACITVDDGYSTFKSNAIPLLKKHDIKATVFINSESVGGGTYMNWDDLKAVYRDGMEIGNHSHSHAYFVNIPKEQRIVSFKNDLLRCQEEINEHLGFYPEIFAYPYGEFDPSMRHTVKEMGFKAAAAQNSGIMYAYDNYAIPRFPMAGPYVNMKGFIEKANMKALRVKSEHPESFVVEGNNPPVILVNFDSTDADLSRHNCFTSGDCETSIEGNSISITSKKALKGRRTLFTITAPAKTGNRWYWYSHLWIRPEVAE